MATGHFTQVVWKASESLGIGFARGRYQGFDDCLFVVGRYKPAGNSGDYAGNVLGEKPNNC